MENKQPNVPMSETAYPEGKAPPKIFGGEASPLPDGVVIRDTLCQETGAGGAEDAIKEQMRSRALDGGAVERALNAASPFTEQMRDVVTGVGPVWRTLGKVLVRLGGVEQEVSREEVVSAIKEIFARFGWEPMAESDGLRARMEAIENNSDDLRKRLAAVLDILRGEPPRSVLLAVPIAQTCPAAKLAIELRERLGVIAGEGVKRQNRLDAVYQILNGRAPAEVMESWPVSQTCAVAKLAIEARQKVDEAANSFTRISNELRSTQRSHGALTEKFEKLLAAVGDERASHAAERASLNSKLQRLATGIHEAHAIIFLTRGANIERDENWRAEFMPLVEAVRVAKTSRPGPQPPETNQDTCAPAPFGASDTARIGAKLSVSFPSASDMLESAWGIIANVNHGNWTGLRNDWVEAATAWRDQMPGCMARLRELEGRGPSKEALEAAGLRAMLQDKDRRLGELEDLFRQVAAARTKLNAALEAAGEAVRK